MNFKIFLLMGVLLVLMGYRWGSRKKPGQPPQPAQVVLQPAAPKKEWLSVKLLLAVVIVLLIIAIFSSLQR